ncbi:MAG: PQQ-dependent sugar dehydrogenase, partial [Anaerolineales bacterium]|nr:PQQ-dependent sugar dehydrogenase [Anaerolineales bacterium]
MPLPLRFNGFLLWLISLVGLVACEQLPSASPEMNDLTPTMFNTPPPSPTAVAQLVGAELELFAEGFAGPITSIQELSDGRLLVAQNSGAVRVVQPDGKLIPEDFLRLGDRVGNKYDFGILGLVADPNFDQNGHVYVNYVDPDQVSHIARFTSDLSEPLQGDPDSEQTILRLPQPGEQHNGGGIAFGTDGYLYVPMGDGIENADADNLAQDKSELFGKLLRLDVQDTLTYTIPPDNPFIDDPTARPEIWATGLRNPYSIVVDEKTGDIFIGDVGEKAWEEINHIPAGQAGLNFGWSCREGSAFFKSDCGQTGAFTAPVYEYAHEG